eukprot:gene20010-21971_t
MDTQTQPLLQAQIEVITLGKGDENEIPIHGDNSSVQCVEEQATTIPIVHHHQRRPRALNALKCSKCNKRFRNPTLLQQHVKLHRASRTVYKCRRCPETFAELGKFLQHREIHPPLAKKRRSIDFNTAFQQVMGQKQTDGQGGHGVPDSVGAEGVPNIGLSSASSLMNALCSALNSQSDNQPQPQQQQQASTVSAKPGGSEGIQIELPTQVKAIYFNHQSPNLNELMNFMLLMNAKMDAIIKHFNVPLSVQQASIDMSTSIKPQQEDPTPSESSTTPTSVTHTPPVVHTPTTKEQQHQDYYASTLINASTSKPWLNTVSPFTLNMPHIPEQTATLQTATALQSPIATNAQVSYMISDSIIEKVFLESRSRGNFAKNLTFQVFTPEERRGRNCTGRVFGRAVPKGPLEAGKLNAVKEATFRKYPVHPSLIDITWKKECITAVDSGLRNETRTRMKPLDNQENVQ